MMERSYFPKVGLFASSEFAHFYTAAARAVGVDLILLDVNQELSTLERRVKECSVITALDISPSLSTIKTLERSGFNFSPNSKQYESLAELAANGSFDQMQESGERILVQVARSPHGQVATWAPTLIEKNNRNGDRGRSSHMAIAPAPNFAEELLISIQSQALNIAGELGAIGILSIEFAPSEASWKPINLQLAPSKFGLWTLYGAVTSQFEQHLRAILDLPLGNTSMQSRWTVFSELDKGSKEDMYRPYLHLMARNPAMKFWQGGSENFMVISGDDLEYLKAEAHHADAYFKGEIDE